MNIGKIEPNVTDEDYEVEIVGDDEHPTKTGEAETKNIEQEGDPIGDNFV